MKYVMVLAFLAGMILPAEAASLTCPDTGTRLTRTDEKRESGEIYLTDINFLKYHQTVCQYGRKNKIVLNWLTAEPVQELASARSTCSWVLKNSGGQPFRTIVGKSGANLYSNTHMVSARLYLSKKEMEPRRRQVWVDHAYDLIKSKMGEALVCAEVLGGTAPQAPSAEPARQPTVPRTALPSVQPPAPPASSENVDAEIDDILERLKGWQE